MKRQELRASPQRRRAWLQGFDFPLIVKPAGWGGGLGVNLARNWSDLKGLLGLASGAEAAMVVQPALDASKLVDYRVYYVDGEPHTVLARQPREGEVIANLSRGGKADLVAMPEGPGRGRASRIRRRTASVPSG